MRRRPGAPELRRIIDFLLGQTQVLLDAIRVAILRNTWSLGNYLSRGGVARQWRGNVVASCYSRLVRGPVLSSGGRNLHLPSSVQLQTDVGEGVEGAFQ